MAGLFSGGLVLEQHKEPALSRDLRRCAPAGNALHMEREPVREPSALSPAEILEIARDALIIDERDGTLLADKLRAAKSEGAELLVGDAIDDEPYVSSQMNPLFKLAKEATGGLLFAAQAIGAEQTQFAVYKNLSDVQIRIPPTLYGVRVKRITGKYPVESREYFGSMRLSTVLVGVCALIHLYRAVHSNIAQTTSFVTVAGDCVANPSNLEVATGTSFQQILEKCGLVEEPSRIIAGGPMTGRCILRPESTPVEPTTRAVLAFRHHPQDKNYQCIGCGRCAVACPQRLAPVFLYQAALSKNLRGLRLYDARSCIGCGTCSYACPAKLDLSAVILDASRMLARLEDRAAKEAGASEDQKEGVHAQVL